MGTNYYLHAGICKCCGRPEDIYHIGKSSAGWKFLFQAYEFEEGSSPQIKNIKDWLVLLKNPSYKIYDEYGKEWDVDDFLRMVQTKELEHTCKSHVREYGIPKEEWIDEQGYDFSLRGFS